MFHFEQHTLHGAERLSPLPPLPMTSAMLSPVRYTSIHDAQAIGSDAHTRALFLTAPHGDGSDLLPVGLLCPHGKWLLQAFCDGASRL